MNRIALLSKNRTLKILVNGDTVTVIVNGTGKPLSLLMDWAKIPFAKVILEITTCQNVDLLEILTDKSTDVVFSIKPNAHLSWGIVDFASEKASKIQGVLESGATLKVAYADFSQGDLSLDATISLRGDGSYVDWHLASLSAKKNVKNVSVSFNHLGKDTYAMMNNYGVAEDSASLVFSGTSHIFNGSHHSKTHQNAKIMVFDPNCLAKANPVLKIDENDIEASHSASVGKVNDDHLFYLCSRGLSNDEAKRLITLGYLNPIISHFQDVSIREQIAKEIELRV